MTPFYHLISNFEKNIVLLLTRQFFSRKLSLVKMEPKGNSTELSTVLKYRLTKVKKAPSQMLYLVLNMPL